MANIASNQTRPGAALPQQASAGNTTGRESSPPNPYSELQPYLRSLWEHREAFPAINSLLSKLTNTDFGRKLVQDWYQTQIGRVPGRCYCLQFRADGVSKLSGFENGFPSPESLREYLADHPAQNSRLMKNHRLFILEDLHSEYVDALGWGLGVDPLVFVSQMDTWNFTDSVSVPSQVLPSTSSPEQSFTLRYYETRTLEDPGSIDTLRMQTTFAINRRRYQRWRQIDLPAGGVADKQTAFIRRCASFWTSQEPGQADEGWDAVLLVDPAVGPYILQDAIQYHNRGRLWNARLWDGRETVGLRSHSSHAYHGGSLILPNSRFKAVATEVPSYFARFPKKHERESPLDILIFAWTKVAPLSLVDKAIAHSPNAAYHLLKYVAQHWNNQLEMVNTTIYKGEYLREDYKSKIDEEQLRAQWKVDLLRLKEIEKDVDAIRRDLTSQLRAATSNLVRLGVVLGCEAVDADLPLALKDAQKDFITIRTSLQPLCERAEALTGIIDDLSNMRAGFKSISNTEYGLRLLLFVSAVIFPMTLVASIFSMGDDYRPGGRWFWKFWAVSMPFVAAFVIVLVPRPSKLVQNLLYPLKLAAQTRQTRRTSKIKGAGI